MASQTELLKAFEAQDVAVGGLCCVDFLQSIIGELPDDNCLKITGPVKMASGGAGPNVGRILGGKMGLKTLIMGAIGDDAPGGYLREVCGYTPNCTRRFVFKNDFPTSTTNVLQFGAKERKFLHCPGANEAFAPEDIDADPLRAAGVKLFHFGYLPLHRLFYQDEGAGAMKAFSALRSSKIKVSMDMVAVDPESDAAKQNWANILINVLPFVTFFMPSVPEMMKMLPMIDWPGDENDYAVWEKMANLFLDWGCQVVVLKLGYLGLYLKTRDTKDLRVKDQHIWRYREIFAVPFKERTDIAYTTGAGDASIAGFIAAMLKGKLTPHECLEIANGVSTSSVEQPDAYSGVMEFDAVCDRIKGGWRLLHNKIPKDFVPSSDYSGIYERHCARQ